MEAEQFLLSICSSVENSCLRTDLDGHYNVSNIWIVIQSGKLLYSFIPLPVTYMPGASFLIHWYTKYHIYLYTNNFNFCCVLFYWWYYPASYFHVSHRLAGQIRNNIYWFQCVHSTLRYMNHWEYLWSISAV